MKSEYDFSKGQRGKYYTPNFVITKISSDGIWININDGKLFMSYKDFPWFKGQPQKSILLVEELSLGHFYWPDLDIDLTEEIIRQPERYPLKAKGIALNDDNPKAL